MGGISPDQASLSYMGAIVQRELQVRGEVKGERCRIWPKAQLPFPCYANVGLKQSTDQI